MSLIKEQYQNKKSRYTLILVFILLLAVFLRLYGLNWDQGQHLHPDERFLTMVLTSMKIPGTFLDYLNPNLSTMNPYNIGYSFFVYGTFPLFLTKIVGYLTFNNDYWNIHLVGRVLSALFDTGVVFLLYKIGKKIFNEKIGLLAAFLYSIMVLPIQLSHFFTVDTFLNFFIVLSFYLLVKIFNTKYLILNTIFLGISFGLALACKISALYFLPIIGLGYLYLALKYLKSLKCLRLVIFSGIIFGIFCYLIFRLAQPSFFSSGNFLNFNPNPKFITNLKEQSGYCSKDSWMPPVIQWKSTTPIIFPLKNLIYWGLGIPLGLLSIFSIVYTIMIVFKGIKGHELKRNTSLIYLTLIILWIGFLFLYEGVQICKTIRYFLPIYPFLALLSANLLNNINNFIRSKYSKKSLYILHCTFYILILVYPISFLSIYSHPITRVSASEWIYKNVPAGLIVLNEEWDDGLPLPLPNNLSVKYKGESVFLYDPDTENKWVKINEKLNNIDYIFISSNRTYGSTMKLPKIYPQTIKYYQSLFDGTGEFKKTAEFTSYPCFPPVGKHWFCFNDDDAEESFTVYDHPKVMIFKKNKIRSNSFGQ